MDAAMQITKPAMLEDHHHHAESWLCVLEHFKTLTCASTKTIRTKPLGALLGGTLYGKGFIARSRMQNQHRMIQGRDALKA